MTTEMFSKFVKTLIVFAIIAFSVSLFVNIVLNIDLFSVAINILTDLFGVFFTIFYINKILDEHEKKKWKNVKFKVAWRIESFIEKSLVKILNTIDLRDKLIMSRYYNPIERFDLSYKMMFYIDPSLIEVKILSNDNLYEKQLRKNLPNPYEIESLEKNVDEIHKTIALFGSQIDPQILDYTMKTIEDLEKLIDRYPYYYDKFQTVTKHISFLDPDSEETVIAAIGDHLFEVVRDLATLHNLITAPEE